VPTDVIEARGLTRRFGDVLAVDAIDLRVGEGEVVAVLGPNGAGKTTTLEMLLGLRSPSSGTIRVFGDDPTSARVRGRVGAMLQDTDAPESLTVTEMVDLVAAYYPYRLPTAEVLERASLGGHRRRRVTQLSGGERQRLSFALAIAGDPDLLYLDEPTASLDVAARRAFWRHVSDFAALGKTILFSPTTWRRPTWSPTGSSSSTPAGSSPTAPRASSRACSPAGRSSWSPTPPTRCWPRSPGVRGTVVLHEDPGTAGRPGVRRVRLQAPDAEPVLRALFATGRTWRTCWSPRPPWRRPSCT
jgi:ABC-2 type transport system ATP-binding protein